MGDKVWSRLTTVLIIIFLGIVILGIIWTIINKEDVSNTDDENITINIEMTSVKINETSIEINVSRNTEEGNLSGIQFMLSDGEIVEIIKMNTVFDELGEKIFIISKDDLNKIELKNIIEISLAPVVRLNYGENILAPVTDIFEVIIIDVECVIDADCGPIFMLEPRYCSDDNSNILKDQVIPTCSDEICINITEQVKMESCSGGCDDGRCRDKLYENETDKPPIISDNFSEYAPGLYEFELAYKESNRTYNVYIPSSYNASAQTPVVLNLHGGGGNAEAAEKGIGGMNSKSEENGFIAVYPEGTRGIGQKTLNTRYWNAGTLISIPQVDSDVDDVGFISSMIDQLEKDFNIDEKRIYATGISNGAWMTYALACDLSDKIAAIAPVAGGLILEDCNPERPISIMHFHGTGDPGWPYNGGNSCWTDTSRPPINNTLKEFKQINSCSSSSEITLQDGGVTCETYGCSQETEITFCTVEDGGHTFPGGYTNIIEQFISWDSDCELGTGRGVGEINQDIDALDEMWEFFKEHPRD